MCWTRYSITLFCHVIFFFVIRVKPWHRSIYNTSKFLCILRMHTTPRILCIFSDVVRKVGHALSQVDQPSVTVVLKVDDDNIADAVGDVLAINYLEFWILMLLLYNVDALFLEKLYFWIFIWVSYVILIIEWILGLSLFSFSYK